MLLLRARTPFSRPTKHARPVVSEGASQRLKSMMLSLVSMSACCCGLARRLAGTLYLMPCRPAARSGASAAAAAAARELRVSSRLWLSGGAAARRWGLGAARSGGGGGVGLLE